MCTDCNVLTWSLCACAGVLQIRREKQRAKEQAEARAAERAARALEDKREQRVRQQRRKSEQDKWIEGVKEKKKHAVKHSALFGQEVRNLFYCSRPRSHLHGVETAAHGVGHGAG